NAFGMFGRTRSFKEIVCIGAGLPAQWHEELVALAANSRGVPFQLRFSVAELGVGDGGEGCTECDCRDPDDWFSTCRSFHGLWHDLHVLETRYASPVDEGSLT